MKKIELLIAVTISVLTIFFSVFFFVNEKKDFSETENRYLTDFPKYSFESLESGRYIEKIEDYLTDHFPLRDFMMSLKTSTYKILGIKEINEVYIGKDGYLIEQFKEVKNLDKISNIINKFQDKIGFKINVIFAPTSVSINEDKLPDFAINEDQIETINKFYEKMNTNNIDVYKELLKNTNKYQLYYKLDHHWTSYGAYVAYLEYCNSTGITPITEYEIKEVTNEFYGTLYSKTNDYSLKPDTIHTFNVKDSDYTVKYDNNKETNTLYEDSYLDKKDKYSYFLDNNHSLIQITNNKVKNNEEILIIKDSYANSFVPFIVNHYETVYVIDPRYYKTPISEFIEEKEIDNVLLLYNMNTINDDLGIISVR